jgi:hypothetical protein
VLVEFVADFNARNYNRASGDLATARAIPGHSAYDELQIDSCDLMLATTTRDYSAAGTLLDAALSSPALTDRDRLSLYGSAVSLYAAQRDYWRAIQFGERLNRQNALDAATSAALAQAYLADGSYSDAERISQAALYKGSVTDEQRKALNQTLERAQIDLGERNPSFGESLVGAILGGAMAGVAEGLTGQQVDPSVGMPQSADQRKEAAQEAERQAQQRAAAQVLSESPAVARLIYTDLLDRSAHLSKADHREAKRLRERAWAAYQKQDYSSAATDLQNELAIDPATAEANYYYADCVARGANQSLVVIDYLARAVAFDRDGENGSLARAALQGIASPPAQQN